jgi:hypothetical protein
VSERADHTPRGQLADETPRAQLAATIDDIERAYEYLLAYAAQGRRDDAGTEARTTLETLHAALTQIGPRAAAALAGAGPVAAGPSAVEAARADIAAYLAAVEQDARVARGAVALVLSRAQIGSLLVDNLNASVHLRALLTDAFLLDQALSDAFLLDQAHAEG